MNKYTVGIILGVLGAGLTCQAQANQVLEQAPLVLEYNLAGPATVEPEPIFATGIIKTISVSAEFVGQVSLEASANGGIAYTKIINSSPLVNEFIPGNQLRLRATIGPDSSLKKLTIGYTDSSGVSKLYRNPDLANYKNHREIYISGGSREVFNYPLQVDSSRGGLNLPYLNNIYFTSADGQTPLYYYLDSSPSAQNDSAIFYVKVPQIPKEGTKIYVYYNPGTVSIFSSEASGKNRNGPSVYNDANKVFPFFEDFSRQSGIPQDAGNDTSLNAEKWEIIPGLKKEYSIKDGYLQLKDCLVVTRNFKTQEGILEFKAKAEENAGIQVVVRTKVSGQGLSPYEQIVYSSNYPGAEHTIAINNIAKFNISSPIKPLTDYIYQATINSTGILFERYSGNRQEKQAEIKFLDVGNFSEGYIGLKADAGPFSAGSAYFDWVRVRPYVEVEPKVNVHIEKEIKT
ncbi:MAG: DUF2341 domain-containing protein [Candidatus Omnitrophota bacterium]|nr:DUF2341 domain-containing protein [Candidatus Omnitrophota bacterium]